MYCFQQHCSCTKYCTGIRDNVVCGCTHPKCVRLRHHKGCNCTTCYPSNKKFCSSDIESSYESWVCPLQLWIRKAGRKSYLNTSNWKMELKLRMMMYLHYGDKEEGECFDDECYGKKWNPGTSINIVHIVLYFLYTTWYTLNAAGTKLCYMEDDSGNALPLEYMLPFFLYLGEKRSNGGIQDKIQEDAKAVLKKYKLREYNVCLHVQCRQAINYYIDRANCIKSAHNMIVEKNEERCHMRESGKASIEKLPLPSKLKNYLASDRVEMHDREIPPAVYLIVEWFARDIEEREPWDTFIETHYNDKLKIK